MKDNMPGKVQLCIAYLSIAGIINLGFRELVSNMMKLPTVFQFS